MSADQKLSRVKLEIGNEEMMRIGPPLKGGEQLSQEGRGPPSGGPKNPSCITYIFFPDFPSVICPYLTKGSIYVEQRSGDAKCEAPRSKVSKAECLQAVREV